MPAMYNRSYVCDFLLMPKCKCDVCGSLITSKTDVCDDCKKAIKFAKEQRDYINKYYLK